MLVAGHLSRRRMQVSDKFDLEQEDAGNWVKIGQHANQSDQTVVAPIYRGYWEAQRRERENTFGRKFRVDFAKQEQTRAEGGRNRIRKIKKAFSTLPFPPVSRVSTRYPLDTIPQAQD